MNQDRFKMRILHVNTFLSNIIRYFEPVKNRICYNFIQELGTFKMINIYKHILIKNMFSIGN